MRLPIPPPRRGGRNSNRRHLIDQMNQRSKRAASIAASPKYPPARAARSASSASDALREPLPSREYDPRSAERAGRAGRGGGAGASCSQSGRTSATPFTRRLAAMERDGEIMRNRRDAICVVDKARSDRGRGAGPSGRIRFPGARRRRRRISSSARGEMHEGAARRPRGGARSPAPTGAAGPKARSSKCWSAPTSGSSGACAASTASLFVVPEDRRISQDFLVPPAETGGARAGAGGDGRDHRAARRSMCSRSGASSKCSATTPIPAWRSRSRCASTTLPHVFSPRGGTAVRSSFPTSVTDERPQGPRGSARPAARDDRRRDREGFRRRRLLRAARPARWRQGGFAWWWRSPT